jgi:hypothetical protein
MPVDPKYIRDHYASLTDETLLGLERADLTPEAQKIFDAEIRRRGLDIERPDDDANDENSEGTWMQDGNEESEDDAAWIENAFTVTTFSGTALGGTDAADALAALKAAGIPCEILEHEIDPAEESVPAPYREYRVIVPSALGMQATSVLDMAIFNDRFEEDLRTQLESLSNEELVSLNIDVLCAGLLDRAERLRKAYRNEVGRRRKR